MRSICRILLGLFVFLVARPATDAQTLAEALASAAPPDPGQVVLTVGADQVKLPDGASPLGESPNFPTVATDFERATQSFDMVSAIAPPTMTVLSTPPAEPNIYANLSPFDAYILLAASLSDSQWQQLTGETGLAVSDLQTDQQKELFADLLSRDGKLILIPKYHVDETWNNADKIDKSDAIPGLRLRLGQTISVELAVKDGNGKFGAFGIPPADDSARIYQVTDRIDSSDAVGEIRVRDDVPNVPKQSQLDYTAHAFQARVSIGGVKTVGDLVARIAGVTHVEIYADQRIESQSVSHLGAETANAADLLEALAYCVTGTYRQVGPAFVLTNDIVGIGTLHQLWAEYELQRDTLLAGPIQQAAASLYVRHSPKDLSWFDDPGVYTPAQMNETNPSTLYAPKILPELSGALSSLTPMQQEMVQRASTEFNKETSQTQVSTTDKDITLLPSLSAQLIVPGIDQPVDLDINNGSFDQRFLFHPPPSVQYLADVRKNAELKSIPPSQAQLASLIDALKPIPRRAVIVHPLTAAGVDADLAAIKALGLNQMWLDIFSDGTAHIPGFPLSQLPHPLKHGENDILTEAITKGKAAGIAVYPVMDLLFWGQSPPSDAVDLNVLGETSAQAAARWWQLWAMTPEPHMMSETSTVGGVAPDFPGIAVAPFSKSVYTNLAMLIRMLAHRPGVAGIVWRQEDPPGYDTYGNGLPNSSLTFGYNLPTRLAFLRKEHADPVDIWAPGTYISVANLDLPNFDTGNLSYVLNDAWTQFRAGIHLEFLRALYAVANPSGSAVKIPIILKQLRPGPAIIDDGKHVSYPAGWYGSWDDPRKDPPTLHSEGENSVPGQPQAPVLDISMQKKESRVAYSLLTSTGLGSFTRFWFAPNADSPGDVANAVQTFFESGVVLDLADSPFGDNGNGSDPLTDLADNLSGKTKPASASGPPNPSHPGG